MLIIQCQLSIPYVESPCPKVSSQVKQGICVQQMCLHTSHMPGKWRAILQEAYSVGLTVGLKNQKWCWVTRFQTHLRIVARFRFWIFTCLLRSSELSLQSFTGPITFQFLEYSCIFRWMFWFVCKIKAKIIINPTLPPNNKFQVSAVPRCRSGLGPATNMSTSRPRNSNPTVPAVGNKFMFSNN